MFCLRLCAHLLLFHIEIILFAFISIRFWQETAAKTVKVEVAGSNGADTAKPRLMPVFGRLLKNPIVLWDKRKFSICKKAQRTHRARQIYSGTKHGRDVSWDSVGALCTRAYQKRAQNVHRGHCRVPKNIFK